MNDERKSDRTIPTFPYPESIFEKKISPMRFLRIIPVPIGLAVASGCTPPITSQSLCYIHREFQAE